MYTDENILIASATYIENLRRIAREAESIAKAEGYWDETSSALLNFNWLSKKFEMFWFENIEIEELLKPKLPTNTIFSPLDFEKLVQSALFLTQDKIYRETPVTGDRGIDLIHKECIDPNWGAFATTLVQCKLYRGYVPVSDVRDFFGVMTANTASGIFITTGKLTAQTRSFLPLANSSPHSNSLCTLDGEGWRELMKIAKSCYSEIDGVDETDAEMQEVAHRLQVLKEAARDLIHRQSPSTNQGSLF